MPRPKRKLRWIKFYIQETLQGSTAYELTAAQESVWWRLCLLAGQWDDEGIIHTDRNRLAGVLGRPRDLVERTIARCMEVEKIELLADGKLKVSNFLKYNPLKWEKEYYGEERQNKAEQSRIKQNSLPPLKSKDIRVKNKDTEKSEDAESQRNPEKLECSKEYSSGKYGKYIVAGEGDD